MREILFRGKREDNGEWVFGGYAKCNNRHYILPDIDLIGKEWVFKNVEVIPETVGQYIGLTDKNGKKIFEGDIIRTNVYYGNEIGVIRRGEYDVYSRDVFGGYYCVDKTSALISWTSSWGHEVIGTIYDNPELLEVEK